MQKTVDAAAASGTQSLERAIALLRELASHGSRGARLTDLVSDSGFSKGTVRRLLATLIRQGLVEQNETSRRYFLGTELYVLGSIAANAIKALGRGDGLAALIPLVVVVIVAVGWWRGMRRARRR